MISPTANKDLMTQAREALTGKWGTSAIATLIYLLVACVLQFIPGIGFILSLLITGPLLFGYSAYMLAVSRSGTPDIPVLFSGFHSFLKTLFLYIIIAVVVLVGFVLLIVPGILACLALSMAWYIMVDHPEMNAVDVATASYNMTKGNLWKLFCLYFRFLGWILLSCLTLGMGLLFVLPYMQVALARFYEEIKDGATIPPAQ